MKNSRPSPQEAARELLRRRQARRHVLDFARYTFPGYTRAPHLEKLAAHLEAVERYIATGGKEGIGRLIVVMPPRHGKTELTGIRFPAWLLGRNPDAQIIYASYGANLAYSKSGLCRDVIDDPAFSNVFPDVRLNPRKQGTQEWGIAGRRGGMVAAGVGGAITGFGAHLLLIDDPHKNRKEANSATIREDIWRWYISTARTRLEPGGAVVLIQTRWHEDDLAGRLLKQARDEPESDRWTVLHLPALDDDERPLWPERYTAAALKRIRKAIGEWEFAALYQGRPRPIEGALFKRENFDIVDVCPPGLKYVRTWDLAASTRESADYTVGAKVAMDDKLDLWIDDIVRGQWAWPDARGVIIQTAQLDGIGVQIGVEQTAFQLAAVQDLLQIRALAGHTIVGVTVDKDKTARAMPWSSRRVHLRRAPWNSAFIAEVCDFPFGDHDDQVDAVSGAVQMLTAGAYHWTWVG
jgi:predicted phage terminase large subunit-like protein